MRSPRGSPGCVFDLSLTDVSGKIPSPAMVLRACEEAGGIEAAGEVEGLLQAGGAAVAAATRQGVGAGAGPYGTGLPAAGGHTLMASGLGGAGAARIPAMSSLSVSAATPAPQAIPAGRFAFAITGSVDKRRTLGSLTSAGSDLSGL